MFKTILAICGLVAAGGSASAGDADVLDASAQRTAENTYTVSVTVRHDDTGWDHYANRWQVLAPDGTVLGERVLLHPHENEQPFTRSLSGVVISEGIDDVTVRAGDLVHDFGGREIIVELPDAGG